MHQKNSSSQAGESLQRPHLSSQQPRMILLPFDRGKELEQYLQEAV